MPAVFYCNLNLTMYSDISMLDAEAVENVAVIFRTLETLLTKYDPSTLPQEGTYIHIPTVMYIHINM